MDQPFNIIGLLLLAHYLADFPLQSDYLAKNKGKNWYFMMAHCVIWTGLCSLPFGYFGLLRWPMVPFLFFGHWFIDLAKVRINQPDNMRLLYLDQFLHMIQLTICLIVAYG